MTVQAMNKLPWPENLLRQLLLDEAYDEWKSNIPPDFEASFQYIIEETLTERENYILLKIQFWCVLYGKIFSPY